MLNGMHFKQPVKQTKLMIMKNFIYISILSFLLISCDGFKQKRLEKEDHTSQAKQEESISERVDALDHIIKQSITEFELIASLDHHRMAKEEGAYTPPAIATIFSDPKINADLISNKNQLIGLDLPFKVLCYSESDTASVKLAYTSADFIAKRHGISVDELIDYSDKLNGVLTSFDKSIISATNIDSVFKGYGIVELQSDFDFETTIKKLTHVVKAQSDTRWFGEIDYASEAQTFGKELNPTKLLLFGGPAPGAKAMMTTPKIGLDAFCQKLLVYELDNGEVWVAFNDIVDFAKLYYGKTTKPQQGINQRLIVTFTKAIQEE